MTMKPLQHVNATHLRHCLSISQLGKTQIITLLDTAQAYLDSGAYRSKQSNDLADKTIVNIFAENSTRTRASFELAAKRLGADVLNLDMQTSSMEKGETLLDTILTLHAMVCNTFVIRHSQNGICDQLAEQVPQDVRIINAGDGTHAHPSQTLLDLLTIRQHKPDFTQLSVCIVGDIAHSRVARSLICALQLFDVPDIRLVGPKEFLPSDTNEFKATCHETLEEGIKDVDVIVTLRIQKERMHAIQLPNDDDYFKTYGLTLEKLALAKNDAIVMHPAPINRNVEIDDAVVACAQSVILEQARNGVAVRMAILSTL